MTTNTPVDGPFPIRVNTTPSGCELDVSTFLARAVFAQLISAADEDPEGLVDELREMAALQRSAVHQGPDSHARHEYDACMESLVNELADGGTIPVYGAQVGRLAEALASIAAPQPVPGQRGAA
ncbi:hypothetical protein ABZ753_21705 [Streptomyces griseoincarnatus]